MLENFPKIVPNYTYSSILDTHSTIDCHKIVPCKSIDLSDDWYIMFVQGTKQRQKILFGPEKMRFDTL